MWREILEDVVHKTLTGFGEGLGAFGPKLLAMTVILLAGVVAALGLRFGVRRLLPRLGFDRFAARVGLGLLLEKGGIGAPPSSVVAEALAWGTLAAFMLLAIGALDLGIALDLLARAFAYLPQILIAAAVLVFGSLLAAFVRRSVLIAAVNAGLAPARLLAGGVHTALLIVFAAIALEHLGLGRQIILASFVLLFGGVVLALALAFGLAGQSLARDVLEEMAGRRPLAPRREIDPL
jgi:hypothetical protein